MAKREEMSPSLSQRIGLNFRSWCILSCPRGKGGQGCSPFHRQVGPGWNEMSFAPAFLAFGKERETFYRKSCLVTSFFGGYTCLWRSLGDAAWWDLRRVWQVSKGIFEAEGIFLALFHLILLPYPPGESIWPSEQT